MRALRIRPTEYYSGAKGGTAATSGACSIPIAKTRIGESGSWRGIDERLVAVPELTRSAGIQLNGRLSLLELIEIDNNNA